MSWVVTKDPVRTHRNRDPRPGPASATGGSGALLLPGIALGPRLPTWEGGPAPAAPLRPPGPAAPSRPPDRPGPPTARPPDRPPPYPRRRSRSSARPSRPRAGGGRARSSGPRGRPGPGPARRAGRPPTGRPARPSRPWPPAPQRGAGFEAPPAPTGHAQTPPRRPRVDGGAWCPRDAPHRDPIPGARAGLAGTLAMRARGAGSGGDVRPGAGGAVRGCGQICPCPSALLGT